VIDGVFGLSRCWRLCRTVRNRFFLSFFLNRKHRKVGSNEAVDAEAGWQTEDCRSLQCKAAHRYCARGVAHNKNIL